MAAPIFPSASQTHFCRIPRCIQNQSLLSLCERHSADAAELLVGLSFLSVNLGTCVCTYVCTYVMLGKSALVVAVFRGSKERRSQPQVWQKCKWFVSCHARLHRSTSGFGYCQHKPMALRRNTGTYLLWLYLTNQPEKNLVVFFFPRVPPMRSTVLRTSAPHFRIADARKIVIYSTCWCTHI